MNARYVRKVLSKLDIWKYMKAFIQRKCLMNAKPARKYSKKKANWRGTKEFTQVKTEMPC